MKVYCILMSSGNRWHNDEFVEVHATRQGAEKEIARKAAFGNDYARFMVVEEHEVNE